MFHSLCLHEIGKVRDCFKHRRFRRRWSHGGKPRSGEEDASKGCREQNIQYILNCLKYNNEFDMRYGCMENGMKIDISVKNAYILMSKHRSSYKQNTASFAELDVLKLQLEHLD
jgi:hypothetical protein